jgi:hypothetical protein
LIRIAITNPYMATTEQVPPAIYANCCDYLLSNSDNGLRLTSLGSVSGAVDLAPNAIDVRASVLVGSTWAGDIDILNVDVGAYCWAGADKVSN